MSSHTERGPSMPARRRRVTPDRLAEMKAAGEPIAMVTAYDFPSAQVVEEAGVDVVLVGDSAAMTVLGHDSTVPVGMTEMLVLAAAVRRGLRTPLLVGDLPFGSYERSDELAVDNAQRFVKEAGCDAVKLERGGTSVDRARAIVRAGIPVMGHVGLTPQTATQLGGFKAQGRSAARAAEIATEALALQEAGCFALVFEAMPAAVTEMLMPLLSVPVIGIGAGQATDGQVLVFHDLLGIYAGHTAKFVKRYADVRTEMLRGVAAYVGDVRTHAFPGPEHVYAIDPAELAELRRLLDRRAVLPWARAAGEAVRQPYPS
ncbi:MAG TPA: 3-methyl-2-oxobutanoate hydroxymethyltransferase [Actinopolymorphaceae bacterium]|jgi:3-methyl-2-oxobutanoate hydroxymethyltransferase|nr:3-methyl-2-oxobutanoate hydroxymethyltransferase [Actinopolymorphaceae bacterium]